MKVARVRSSSGGSFGVALAE